MTRRQLVPQEHATLHQKAKEVRRFNQALLKLVRDMFETMRISGGVGLAAPQIGEAIRACVVEYDGRSIVLINCEFYVSLPPNFPGNLSLPSLSRNVFRLA